MIVQSKRSQILFFLMAFLAVLCLGIVSYFYLIHSSPTDSGQNRYNAEIVLFLSFLFDVLLAMVFFLILLRNRNIIKELDKIIEMSQYSNFSPTRSLEKLSVMGDRIGQLYRNLNVMNEKRALKISSLSVLNELLLKNIPLPVLVIDSRGEIVSASKVFHERFPDHPDVKGVNITAVYPEVNIQTVKEQLKDTYSSTTDKQSKNELTFYPVRNREGVIAYILCIIGKGTLVQEERERPRKEEQLQMPKNQRRSLLRRFLKGK